MTEWLPVVLQGTQQGATWEQLGSEPVSTLQYERAEPLLFRPICLPTMHTSIPGRILTAARLAAECPLHVENQAYSCSACMLNLKAMLTSSSV
jgi:hypothetical protein